MICYVTHHSIAPTSRGCVPPGHLAESPGQLPQTFRPLPAVEPLQPAGASDSLPSQGGDDQLGFWSLVSWRGASGRSTTNRVLVRHFFALLLALQCPRTLPTRRRFLAFQS